MGIIEDPRECSGQHRFFVAESGTVESLEGVKVCSLIICTACGESKLIEHKVAAGGSYTVTQKKEK